MEPDQAFLEYAVKAITDHPEAVETTRTIDQMGVLLTLTVHPEDMGKIIGKLGKTAEALRILLRVVGMKNNARVNLKINEPVGGRRDMGPSSTGGAMKTVEEAMEGLSI